MAEALAGHRATVGDPAHPRQWDAVDLRRLRCGDPAADALAAAFGAREMEQAWTLNVEREDVCPVAELPVGGTMDDYLATLGKKERHEIRRKVRRAEGDGEVRLDDSTDPLGDLPAFIDLHQRRWGAEGLFPDTEGGRHSRVFFARLFELFGAGGPLRLAFLTIDGRRIAAGVSSRPRRAARLQRRCGPGMARPVPGRGDGGALRAAGDGAGDRADGLPARKRALQVRVGRRGPADPAPARATDRDPMTRPGTDDPCVAPMVHLPVPGRRRVRVVEVMATGTNGGAQEHVFNLVSRLDRDFYDVTVVSLSPGSAVRKLQRHGIDTLVIDEPDDAIATGILAAYLADTRADVIHNHMYRAEIVGTKAAIALGEAGHRRPWSCPRSTRPASAPARTRRSSAA